MLKALLGCMQTPAQDSRDIIDLARVDHFFGDFYRIGLGSTNTNMVSKHIDIGDIGVGNIDIVLVLTILLKKISKNFDPKNCPKNGQKLPKITKICQNLAKNDQKYRIFFEKILPNCPKMTIFFGIGVVSVLQEIFFMLYWS